MLTAKEISTMLAKRALDVAMYLLPNGKRQGNEWCAGNVLGSAGESCKVHLEGAKAGVWSDFATGERGDLLDLWALNRQITLLEALSQATSYLGITQEVLSKFGSNFYVFPKEERYKPLVQAKQYLLDRGLSNKTLDVFKIQERDGEIVFPYYVGTQLVAAKYLKLARKDGKKQIHTEKDCEPCLFGWQAVSANAREITICEGEIDAMSLYEYGISAMSVPFGGGSGQKQGWIEHEFDRLRQFDVINICMDMDEEGQKAAKAIIERLGFERCKLVELPLKDANECLKNGISKEDMHWYFSQAKSFDPDELKTYDYETKNIQEWINPPGGILPGYVSPWQKTHKNIRFRSQELSIWTGINGHGKSQFVGNLLCDMMRQGAKVCLASLEMAPRVFLGRLTRQIAAMESPSNEYIKEIESWFAGKLWYINVLGTMELNRLMEVFTYAKRKYGIDVFLLDSLMRIADVYDEDYKSQKICIEKLCEFKNKYDAQIHLIVHPRKGSDERLAPGKMDVKGTGTITDLADNVFSIWRNKYKEEAKEDLAKGNFLDEKQQESLEMPDCLWRCDKQRNGFWEGLYGLWYDPRSFQYLEREKDKPHRYVDYSSQTE